MSNNTVISNTTVKRLLKDVKDIIKNPLTDQGIYYIHNDTNMMKGYAMIVGPSETPYFGGFYFFELSFPNNYPYEPPTVKYWTNGQNIRFNPNLYTNGKVCLSILNTWSGDQWTSCQTISSILLTICSILRKNALLNEPGINKSDVNVAKYDKIIEYYNISIAFCDIIQKTTGIYQDFFSSFESYINELFKKNYDAMLSFVEKKIEENPEDKYNFQYHIQIYNITCNLNYKHLLDKLKQTKQIFDVMNSK